MTHQRVLRLNWDLMLHSPKFLDFASSDYHLFRLNFDLDRVENHLVQYLYNSDKDCHECRIMEIPKRWQKVLR